uniref:Uncharacterized protein n=1 Tax=Knipowitschia caucasica TaxID=637954 RepID=A0AAV2L6P6_KNICA
MLLPEASLKDLSSKLEKDVTVERFRPNIVTAADYNPVTGRPAPRRSQPPMRLLFMAFLLASLRLLSSPAPSMVFCYTSSQLIRLNHRTPPSLVINSTLQKHSLLRCCPYIHTALPFICL